MFVEQEAVWDGMECGRGFLVASSEKFDKPTAGMWVGAVECCDSGVTCRGALIHSIVSWTAELTGKRGGEIEANLNTGMAAAGI